MYVPAPCSLDLPAVGLVSSHLFPKICHIAYCVWGSGLTVLSLMTALWCVLVWSLSSWENWSHMSQTFQDSDPGSLALWHLQLTIQSWVWVSWQHPGNRIPLDLGLLFSHLLSKATTQCPHLQGGTEHLPGTDLQKHHCIPATTSGLRWRGLAVILLGRWED